ncbi:MAG: hypothetical protein ABI651_08255 [Verrucomicrobiota bacterium]
MADDIETACKRMVADANAQLEKYEKEQVKKGDKKPNSMRTFLSGYDKSQSRTPEEQADEVVAGRSWTCNSSHMADAARHVGPKLNGKAFSDMKSLKKGVTEEDYDEFVEVYDNAMKKQGLMNFKGQPGFLPDSGDPLHLELKDSRLSENDPRVQKCLLTYARATREGGKKKNDKFETENASAKRYLEAYDQAQKKSADARAK